MSARGCKAISNEAAQGGCPIKKATAHLNIEQPLLESDSNHGAYVELLTVAKSHGQCARTPAPLQAPLGHLDELPGSVGGEAPIGSSYCQERRKGTGITRHEGKKAQGDDQGRSLLDSPRRTHSITRAPLAWADTRWSLSR